MPLSLDTPLSVGASYTFTLNGDGGGLYPPTCSSVQSTIAGSLSDEMANVQVSGGASLWGPEAYQVSFAFVGAAGTAVQDLANALNNLLSSHVTDNLVFTSATGGQTVPGGTTGKGNIATGLAGLLGTSVTSSYLIYGVAILVIALVAFGFAKGFGEGAAGDL